MPARAIRVFSSALLRQKLATLTRIREREGRSAIALLRDWQAMAYACADDAQRAGERHCAQADFVTLDVTAQVRTVEGPFKRGRGRPRKIPESALAFKHYRVTYTTTVTNEVSELACHRHSEPNSPT